MYGPQLYAVEGVVSGAQSLPQEPTCVLQLLRKVRVLNASTSDPELKEVVVILHAVTINKLQQGEAQRLVVFCSSSTYILHGKALVLKC